MMKTTLKIFGNVFFTIVLFGLLMAACNKNESRRIEKTDPSSIASENLVAYFPLDSAGEEVINSHGSITWNKNAGEAEFVSGRRGNAYKGSSSEAYLEYNVLADNPFLNMTEFTIAAWIKSPVTTNGGSSNIFNLNGGDIFMHNIDLLQESRDGDSLTIKFYMYSNITPDWKGHDTLKQAKPFLNDRWFHLVVLYNKTTSAIQFWADGKLVHSSVQYSGPKPSEGPQPLLGFIGFKHDMSKILIGAWPQQANGDPDPWMNYFAGMIDELRIYNKALSGTEIENLYEAELSVINP